MRNGALTCSPKFISSFNVWCWGQDAASKPHHCANTNVGGKHYRHMNDINLKIVKRGLRTIIYKIRNASLILFGLTLLIFIIGESFTNEESSSWTAIVYVFIFSIATLLVALLLTIALFYRQHIANISINNDRIIFASKQKTIKLNQLQILLNSDTFEFENAKVKSDGIHRILMTGNQVVSESLPPEQNEWELILTKENRKELLELKNADVALTPMFSSRPILMESPTRLLKAIADFGHGWG